MHSSQHFDPGGAVLVRALPSAVGLRQQRRCALLVRIFMHAIIIHRDAHLPLLRSVRALSYCTVFANFHSDQTLHLRSHHSGTLVVAPNQLVSSLMGRLLSSQDRCT